MSALASILLGAPIAAGAYQLGWYARGKSVETAALGELGLDR